MSNDDLVFPADGYDAFVDFLNNGPSQPRLLEMTRGEIIAAYNKKNPPKFVSSTRSVAGHPAPKSNAAATTPATSRETSSRSSSSRSSQRKVAVVPKPSLVVDDEETWQRNYEALEEFHAEHGTCTVPFGRETGALRSWTERQRKLHANAMLEPDRANDLKALDFDFTMKALSTRSINTTRPPSARSVNGSGSKSARSVNGGGAPAKPASGSSKKNLNRASSSKKQVKGAPQAAKPAAKAPVAPRRASAADKSWDEQHRALQAYHAKFGNCQVPFGKEYGPLRSWCERQKKLNGIGRLEREKVDKLTELGFF